MPYEVLAECKGADLVGTTYEQLIPWFLPAEDAEKAFRVIPGDFVTTEDGTGIVHIAPTFGADDARVGKENGIPPMLVRDENDNFSAFGGFARAFSQRGQGASPFCRKIYQE